MLFHRLFSPPILPPQDAPPLPDMASRDPKGGGAAAHLLRQGNLLLRRFGQVRAESVVPRKGGDGDKEKNKSKRVVVAGGTGFVGSELVRQLTRKGYEVVVVSRRRTRAQGLMTWDELAKDGLPDKTFAVVNLAGHNIMDPWYRWTDQFMKLVRDSRIIPARVLSVAIQRVPRGLRPKVFVQVTGTACYPPHPTKEYDEHSVLDKDGNGFLSRLVFDWEEAARLPSDVVDDVRNVFVRPGAVLGRNGGLVSNVFRQFFLGFGGPMGSGTQPMPWIHVKDLSGIIVHCVENDKIVGVLNGVAPELITNGDFAGAFAKELRRPAAIPVPEFVWKFIFGEERAGMIISGQKVLPRRTLESGFKFRYPTIAEACREFAAFNYKDVDELPINAP